MSDLMSGYAPDFGEISEVAQYGDNMQCLYKLNYSEFPLG